MFNIGLGEVIKAVLPVVTGAVIPAILSKDDNYSNGGTGYNPNGVVNNPTPVKPEVRPFTMDPAAVAASHVHPVNVTVNLNFYGKDKPKNFADIASAIPGVEVTTF